MPALVPHVTTHAPNGMVCSVDHLASAAGVTVMQLGGNAADAAVAASAVLAVTTQHMCGMGGDLFALVQRDGDTTPLALNASGRAGSGADPDRLRARGYSTMPMIGDPSSAPIPGCVDGWIALHDRCGAIDLSTVLAPAIRLAEEGFGASPHLVAMVPAVAHVIGADDYAVSPLRPGTRIRRKGVAAELRGLIDGGRTAFYEGRFGEALVELGAGEYAPSDLSTPLADWVEPLATEVWDHRVWTVPPNSQGYLALSSAAIAAQLHLPDDPDDPAWAHALIESARAAGYDRLDVLHQDADGSALLDPALLRARAARIDPRGRASYAGGYGSGDTVYLCAADDEGMGVSLIQSNASGWGCNLVVGDTGIFLHCRGIGFNLRPGHPGEYGPGRRPAHTLSPTLVTDLGGSLRALVGTMGGDAQPQVVLQLLARLLRGGESVASTVDAGRWALASPHPNGFDTWDEPDLTIVQIEGHAARWDEGLTERGHRVDRLDGWSSGFGHAHIIDFAGGTLAGTADPRALTGSATGW